MKFCLLPPPPLSRNVDEIVKFEQHIFGIHNNSDHQLDKLDNFISNIALSVGYIAATNTLPCLN